MRPIWITFLLIATVSSAGHTRDLSAITAPTTDFTKPEAYERHPGGAATTKKTPGRNVFSQPSANLSFEQRADFFVGNGFFKRLWVTAPASTDSADGLGPLYNARACQRCHLKDGRGHPPEGPDDSAVSMLMRLSVPPGSDVERDLLNEHQAKVIPEPTYGGQLQDLAIAGHKAEGRVAISYDEQPVELADGEVVVLRAPAYTIDDLAYGPLHPKTMMSPRIAQPMIGLGLLEAIAAEDILANADPDDADSDGISGKPNRVWSHEHDQVMLGRFGWKAGNPTLHQQNSDAMAGDIGISNPLFPNAFGDCTSHQKACRAAPDGRSERHDGHETGHLVMDKILFYTRNLAVPVRRDIDNPTVLRGKKMFYESGCIACHTPKYITPQGGRPRRSSFPIDLALHRPAPPRYGRRPSRQSSRR